MFARTVDAPSTARESRRPGLARRHPTASASAKGRCACGGKCPRCSGHIAGAFDAFRPEQDRASPVTTFKLQTPSKVGPCWDDCDHTTCFDKLTPYHQGIFNGVPHFVWTVDFVPANDFTGWIIQEVTSTYSAQPCVGAGPLVNMQPQPLYWEAWQVDRGRMLDKHGDSADIWARGMPPDSTGSWSIQGRLYMTDVLPPTGGFAPGGVPNAGDLQSTTTRPDRKELGDRVGPRRIIGGTWACCPGATHEHHES